MCQLAPDIVEMWQPIPDVKGKDGALLCLLTKSYPQAACNNRFISALISSLV